MPRIHVVSDNRSRAEGIATHLQERLSPDYMVSLRHGAKGWEVVVGLPEQHVLRAESPSEDTSLRIAASKRPTKRS